MAQLIKLARQFQQALGGYNAQATPSAALTAAGLRTTLAASIISYLERIPWAAVTPQMLIAPAGTLFAAVETSVKVLEYSLCASNHPLNASGSSSLAAHILEQVSQVPSFHLPGFTICFQLLYSRRDF